jgi:ferredoxin
LCNGTMRPSMRRSPTCTKSSSRPGHQHVAALPPVTGSITEFRRAGHQRHRAAKAICCRSAPCRSTAPSRRPRAVRETQHRGRDPDLGRGHLHPVRAVRLGLPPCGDSRQGVSGCAVAGARRTFLSRKFTGKDLPEHTFTIQVAPDDCTGCGVCVDVCPAKSKEEVKHKAINMEHKLEHLERERKNYDFFLSIPELDRSKVNASTVKGSQLLLPLFEYSGACAGCGETPYVKLMSQLFGDRIVAPTRRVARRSTAATCRRRRTRSTPRAAGRPGATRCSKTTPSSAWASAWPWTCAITLRNPAQDAGRRDRRRSGGRVAESPQDSEEEIFAQRRRIAASC